MPKSRAVVFRMCLGVFVLVMLALNVLPNYPLVVFAASSGPLEILQVVANLFVSEAAFAPWHYALKTVVVALFSFNLALFVAIRGESPAVAKKSGIVGSLFALFGIGCLSCCGTAILGALLPLLGAGVLVSALPFGGLEFSVLAAVLLIYSIYRTLHLNISVCLIDAPPQDSTIQAKEKSVV